MVFLIPKPFLKIVIARSEATRQSLPIKNALFFDFPKDRAFTFYCYIRIINDKRSVSCDMRSVYNPFAVGEFTFAVGGSPYAVGELKIRGFQLAFQVL